MRTPETPQPLWTYGLSIPHDPRAVGVVRATIRSILAATKLNCIVDTVELLVSEVVTNAYRCSAQETYVSMERTPEGFRVTVWDHGSGAPAPRRPLGRGRARTRAQHRRSVRRPLGRAGLPARQGRLVHRRAEGG